MKVFHAARQDLEIFAIEGDTIPSPLFDTQVAAMVCGFGEQVGYETLARKVAQAQIDKSSRFTDWSRRPLSTAQATYALADVTHLRVIYEHLAAELEKTGRTSWVEEEMAVLRDPGTYRVEPAGRLSPSQDAQSVPPHRRHREGTCRLPGGLRADEQRAPIPGLQG